MRNIVIALSLTLLTSCATKFEYRPYREHSVACTEKENSGELSCIEFDGDFDGTDLHKEYEADFSTWGDMR